MREVLQVLAPSEGGIRRHVRYLVTHPPRGYTTAGVAGPAELATYFEDVPFVSQASRWSAPVDLIHAHGFSAAVAALKLQRRLGVGRRARPPVVMTIHTSPDQTLLARLPGAGRPIAQRAIWLMGGILARRLDAVIAVAPGAAARVRGARLIPPAVDLPGPASRSREEVRAELGTPAEAIVVLSVSRLHPDKGLDLLVNALRGSSARGWIAGEGPERTRLERLINGSPVRLLGNRSDVPDLLAAADIFALPSRGEAYGFVVLEALSAGLPIVATRVGAVPDILGDAGIVVNPGEPAGFEEALRCLIESESLRRELAARAASTPLPSAEELVARIGAVYDEVCWLS